jgi:multidrug efflux system outer membrane protein
MKHIYIITAVFIFAGCKVSKDVGVPENAVPVTYRGSIGSDTSSVATLPWKDFFSDPDLQTLIAEGLSNNFDLQVAIKNIESARLVLQQAKQGNVPTLGVQASATTNRPSDNSLNGLSLNQFLGSQHIEDYTLAVLTSWEADIWGKIKNQKAAALAGYLQTEEARNLLQTQIVSDISKGYYNLLMLDAQLAIARKNIDLNDSTILIIQFQFEAGQVTSLALQQAKAQRLTAAALVPRFEQDIAVQENALSILTGKTPDSIKRGLDLENASLMDSLSAGVPSSLLSRRPDVKYSELALSRANANVGYAKASMYPSLTITAQGGLNAFKASSWFNIPASLFGTATAGLTQPVFQHRALRTQYEVAKITRDQTVIRFRQSVLVAVEEVSDALIKLDRLREQQTLISRRVSTLQEATQNARMLFNNGLANYLEVITAQGNVLQSELEMVTVKKSRLDAAIDLYRSVGGGWN